MLFSLLPFSLLHNSQTSSNLYLVFAATMEIGWTERGINHSSNPEVVEEILMEKNTKKINKMELFNKKKNEIFKKAKKITSLCDAEVSIILISSEKLCVYNSPDSTMKKIIDQYQSTVGVDLWSSHYEKMQEKLRRLTDINTTLRSMIRERQGEDLDSLNLEQLCKLEEEMLSVLQNTRDRKYRELRIQMDVCRKKVKNLEDIQYYLRNDLEEYWNRHGIVVNEGGYDSAVASAARTRADYGPVQQPRLETDEGEHSCVTTVDMEVEDST